MKEFFRNEDGQGMVEYGLILGLIAVAAIGAIVLLGPKLVTIFTKASTALEDATK